MFFVRLALLPYDLVLLTFHFVKGLTWRLLDTFKGTFELPRETAYPFGCLTESDEDGNYFCLPGRKYANHLVFSLLCPDPIRNRGCSRCETRCSMRLAESHDGWRPSWFRMAMVGIVLSLVWAVPGYYGYCAAKPYVPDGFKTRVKARIRTFLPGNDAQATVVTKASQQRANAFLAHGKTLAAAGKTNESILEYRNAVRTDPKNADAQFALGTSLIDIENYGDGVRALEEAVRLEPNHNDARLHLARLYSRFGNPEPVIAHCTPIIDHDSQHTEALLRRGIALAVIGDIDAARRDAAAATIHMAATPTPERCVLLGSLHVYFNEPDVAQRFFEQAVTLDPDYIDAKLELVRLNLSAGDTTSARTQLNAVLAIDPDNIKARSALAESHIVDNDIRAAITAYEKLVDTTPDNLDLKIRLAELLISTQKADAGFQLLQTVINQSPNNPRCHYALARMYFTKQLFSSTIEHTQHVLDLLPEHYGALILMAKAKAASNAPQEALAYIDKADKVRPQQLGAMLLKAHLFVMQADLDSAKQTYHETVAAFPDAAAAYLGIANIWSQHNERKQAAAYYRKVLEVDPNHALAANNLAMIYLDNSERLDEALALAILAVRQFPRNPFYLDTLGWAYYQNDDNDNALKFAAQAYRLSPKRPTIAIHAAKALLKAQRPDDAEKVLTQLLMDGSPTALEHAEIDLLLGEAREPKSVENP